MSNQYFQFKQFRIDQGQCAMKVTTDACIQGAWTPLLPAVKRILDIGAGTGLLSLMLAQRKEDALVDAIEYDHEAAIQARENVGASPWPQRVNIIEADVCAHAFHHQYDLIISNPPFFNNSLLSGTEEKDRARHTISLSYDSLLAVIDKQLAPGGYASVLLPHAEYLQWKMLLDANGWQEQQRLLVKHTDAGRVNRVVCLFGKGAVAHAKEHTLVIKDGSGTYTKMFSDILSPFYLHM